MPSSLFDGASSISQIANMGAQMPNNMMQQISQVMSMLNGKDPKQAVLQIAKQRGIDINQIQSMIPQAKQFAKQLNLK